MRWLTAALDKPSRCAACVKLPSRATAIDPEEAAQTLALMREAGIDTGGEFAPP